MAMDHASVPFYQAFTDETRIKIQCAVLLLGNGEVLGFRERHLSLANVSELNRHGGSAEPYEWYVQMRQINKIHLAIVPRMKGQQKACRFS